MSYKSLHFFALYCCAIFLSLSSNANEQTDDIVLFQSGVQMAADGNWSQSLKTFEEISARNPTWLESKNNIAVALYQLGELENAKTTLEEAANSLHSLKITLENRKKLYNYSASLAYFKAVDENKKPALPQLSLIKELTLLENKRTTPKLEKEITQIKETLFNWAKSWSDTDAKQYLSNYSNSFRPTGTNKNLEDWKKQRTIKFSLTNIDKIELNAIQVFLNDENNKALVQFIQKYQSKKYSDKVLKQIEFIRNDGRWLIASEIVLNQIN